MTGQQLGSFETRVIVLEDGSGGAGIDGHTMLALVLDISITFIAEVLVFQVVSMNSSSKGMHIQGCN